MTAWFGCGLESSGNLNPHTLGTIESQCLFQTAHESLFQLGIGNETVVGEPKSLDAVSLEQQGVDAHLQELGCRDLRVINLLGGAMSINFGIK